MKTNEKQDSTIVQEPTKTSSVLSEKETIASVDEYTHGSSNWWVYEVWAIIRKPFIILVGHVIFFLLLLLALVIAHFVIEVTHLPQEKKDILNELDFIGIYSCLVVFTVGFIIEFIVLTARRVADDLR